MSIKKELENYESPPGYYNPYPVIPNSGRQSDNALMFTSEAYYIMAANSELTFGDPSHACMAIFQCIEYTGSSTALLYRSPDDRKGQEGPDNYVAMCSLSVLIDISYFAASAYRHGLKHWGFLNNHNPNSIYNEKFDPSFLPKSDGTVKGWFRAKIDGLKYKWRHIHWEACLFRQPGLVASLIAAGGLARWYHTPLFMLTGLILALSGRKAERSNYDAFRLAWHVSKATSKTSFWCRLGSKYFYKNLHKVYPSGMMELAQGYYQPSGIHPFSRYKWE